MFWEIVITSGIVSVFFTGISSLILEKYKSTNLIKSYVTQAQFDKEFNVYQMLWELLFPAKMSVLNLRPVLDLVDPNETKEERQLRRLKQFYNDLVNVRDLLEKNEPFIDKSIYQKIVEILEASHKEAIDFEHSDHLSARERWDEQKKNHQQINDLIENASELIRLRLRSVEIIK